MSHYNRLTDLSILEDVPILSVTEIHCDSITVEIQLMHNTSGCAPTGYCLQYCNVLESIWRNGTEIPVDDQNVLTQDGLQPNMTYLLRIVPIFRHNGTKNMAIPSPHITVKTTRQDGSKSISYACLGTQPLTVQCQLKFVSLIQWMRLSWQ